jgi:hypothetical protein
MMRDKKVLRNMLQDKTIGNFLGILAKKKINHVKLKNFRGTFLRKKKCLLFVILFVIIDPTGKCFKTNSIRKGNDIAQTKQNEML